MQPPKPPASHKTQSQKMLKACPSNQGRRHNFLIGQISCFLFSGLVWQCWINYGALSWAITLEYWKGLERISFFEGSELGIIGRLFSIRFAIGLPTYKALQNQLLPLRVHQQQHQAGGFCNLRQTKCYPAFIG